MKQTRPHTIRTIEDVMTGTREAPVVLPVVPKTDAARPSGATAGPELYADIPNSVFLICLLGWSWILVVFWIVFGGRLESAFMVAISTGFFIMFFGLAGALMALRRDPRSRSFGMRTLIHGGMDTWTGHVGGWGALIQVASVPLGLAGGLTLIGVVILLTRP